MTFTDLGAIVVLYVALGFVFMSFIRGPRSGAKLRWPAPPTFSERLLVLLTWPFILIELLRG